jgi:DNA-binding MarR family transcriptional regulator
MAQDSEDVAASRATPDVASILEQVRLAEAKLARKRQHESGLVETDRAAMRFVLENSDVHEVTPSMIARALHLSPASGTALVDRLLAQGMITVKPHPRDRRKKIVRPLDRNTDLDHLDPLTTRLRQLAAQLTAPDAVIVGAFLENVLKAMNSEHMALRSSTP